MLIINRSKTEASLRLCCRHSHTEKRAYTYENKGVFLLYLQIYYAYLKTPWSYYISERRTEQKMISPKSPQVNRERQEHKT